MSDGHSQRAHSLLSASGSDRWMNCTPSARKEEHIESVESPFALEGTLAHELGEVELRRHFGLITEQEYKTYVGLIEDNDYYNDEMPEYVDVYVSYCIEQVNYYKSICKHVEISIEEKIDLTEYIPEGFGSNDFVIVADNYIEVIDLKYGRGVIVSAYENSQLKLYGLGSVFKHRLSYNMKEVKLTVIQPRTSSSPISSFVIEVDELENWAETEVRVKANMAHNGEGEFNPGSWCKWCKFKPQCKAVYNQNIELMKEDFKDPETLSDDEIRLVFERREQITSWLDSVNAYVLDKLMKKQPFDGYKLVKGRSTRKFAEPTKVIEVLSKNYNPEDYMSQPKLLGITAIEKLVGKKNVPEVLGDLITKTEPKPSIALLSDKRDDYFDSAENDFL